jgi:hypothetical protein
MLEDCAAREGGPGLGGIEKGSWAACGCDERGVHRNEIIRSVVMRVRELSMVCGCAAVCGFGALALRGGEPVQVPSVVEVAMQDQPVEMPSEEMIKAMLKEQATLAPQHKYLESLVGTFDAEMNFLMEPGGEPDKTKGVAKNTSMLGGRFVGFHFDGDVNMFGDIIKFSGFGMMGFDKAKGEFVMTWADTMSTTMLVSYGKPGADGKRIEVSGVSASPMGEANMKHVYVIESKDKHTLEFYQGEPGSDDMMKVGWINYTRKGN